MSLTDYSKAERAKINAEHARAAVEFNRLQSAAPELLAALTAILNSGDPLSAGLREQASIAVSKAIAGN